MMEQKQVTHQDLAIEALDRIAQHEKECGERWAEAIVELRELRKATDAHAMRWEKLAWLVVASAVTAAVTIVTTVIVQREYIMVMLGSIPTGVTGSSVSPIMAGGSAGTGSGVGGFLSNLGNLGNAVGGFLGGTGGQLIGAGLSISELNKITDIAQRSAAEQAAIGREAQEASAFRPFTVSTGFGGVQATPEGGYATTLDPSLAGQQQQLQALTGGLIGGMGGVAPDVSGIQQQALGGVGGFLTGAMAPMGAREAEVYERIRATQRPEEQRAQLALEERLAAQGRTGLRTAQFGGSPEQLALAQAQEEAKARASLGALGQAQAEQLQQMGLAESMFGLGGRAAGLPQALQAGQLGNIQAAMGLQYMPEQQLLGTLTPAISIADLAGVGQRQGAGYMSQAGISGLEDILQAETVRSQNLRDIYSTILGAQANQQAANTAAAGTAATNTGLFSGVGGIVDALKKIF